MDIYTRASVKENGYRFQLHVGEEWTQAFTRQFTSYDLRMFPELTETFKRLPVMIGDTEIINAMHKHMAGFNRVGLRIPASPGFWPKRGEKGINEEILKTYLANGEFFTWGVALPDMRLMLAFHGLFAIAHPSTWEESREIQAQHLISLCELPVDYKKVDEMLALLGEYLKKHQLGLNVRIVEQFIPKDKAHLRDYVAFNEKSGLEGTCVVQSGRDTSSGVLQVLGHSIKIKTYETLDTALLGFYLHDKELGVNGTRRVKYDGQNISAALLGLWDETLKEYLPVTKVNLDPNGVQIKTRGQRERLIALRGELVAVADPKIVSHHVMTLWDVFAAQGEILLKYLLGPEAVFKHPVSQVCAEIPRGHDLFSVLAEFNSSKKEVGRAFVQGSIKNANALQKYLLKHYVFFRLVSELDATKLKRFKTYFARAKDVKKVSARLKHPDVAVMMSPPIILETKVFGVKWGESPYPAGFHSWYGNSFHFNNCFAERIRFDKQSTTPYETVFVLARRNTVRKVKKKMKK
jgi:hypothetical protein